MTSSSRDTSWSFRLEIIRVSCPLATPCATSAYDSDRTSAAHCTSDGRSGARRIDEASSRTERRCSPNRSRSETTPATPPDSSTSTTWRMPRRAIATAASPAVACIGSVITGVLITPPIGSARPTPGSTMRPITSCRVKMPTGRPASSTTGSDPMRRSSIMRSASPSGVAGATVTGSLRISAPSDVARPRCSVTADAYSAWKRAREMSRRCASLRVQKSWNGADTAISWSNTSTGNASTKVSSSDR